MIGLGRYRAWVIGFKGFKVGFGFMGFIGLPGSMGLVGLDTLKKGPRRVDQRRRAQVQRKSAKGLGKAIAARVLPGVPKP